MRRALGASLTCALGALWLGACGGPQSALDPGGRAAGSIADLFWALAIGAGVIWLVSVALWIWAIYSGRRPQGGRGSGLLIVGAGVVLPTVGLAALLSHSLTMLPDLLAPAPAGSLRVRVTGHQWWWRVHYLRNGSEEVELANEVHLPVGEPVQLELVSRDVIHSFWIPALGGKMDMIPGRRTRLTLEPTRTGIYRGTCAEYCGTAHALMSLFVVVEEPAAFADWLGAQRAPAAAAPGPLAERGRDLFLTNGCGACHAVRGTTADGVLGPDLTHVGSRLSLGAGALANDAGAFRRFVARTNEVKPSVHMPAFGMLPDDELDALAAYLEALK